MLRRSVSMSLSSYDIKSKDLGSSFLQGKYLVESSEKSSSNPHSYLVDVRIAAYKVPERNTAG
ncbi:hypothetical protein LUA82_01605 [Neoehrlichia mikurensis]|uniref:Uncharacterized protein n=2 Tax=Neoehrlichia mikurensis TaxID=89586 RepID=A0A9Q9C100_9RICK|nr:hypothetical protein [Neoehrlichia mikurensis]UTO55755.1 hypothetical protein LUA82_01605 [Neoehrlichia mikurensis]UTO56672.1 hypothetical protein LUA81_01595 [Neoehrlichia mikurensis]